MAPVVTPIDPVDDETGVLADANALLEATAENAVAPESSQVIDTTGGVNSIAPVAFDGPRKCYIGDPAFNGWSGRVLFYERPVDTWLLTRTLTNPDSPTATSFGSSVSVSNGSLAVSAPGRTVGAYTNSGVIYIYTDDGTVLEQTLEMGHYGKSNCCVGWNGRLVISGNALVCSSTEHETGPFFYGVIYYWTRSGTVWTEGAEIADPAPGAFGRFGTTLAFDGTRIVSSKRDSGIAIVLKWNGSAWAQEQAIIHQTGYWCFINVIAINGTVLTICSINGADLSHNHLKVYELSGGVWSQQSDTFDVRYDAGIYSTFKLSIPDSTTMVYGTGMVSAANGVLYVYSKLNGVWELAVTLSPTTAHPGFGASVASVISAGEIYVAGGHFNAAGEVEIFHARAGNIAPEETKLEVKRGGAAWVTAYEAETPQPGYAVVRTPTAGGYTYEINPSVDWGFGQLVQIRVTAKDIVGNQTILVYSFTVGHPPYITDLNPLAGAIHPGWKPIVLAVADDDEGVDIYTLCIAIGVEAEVTQLIINGTIQQTERFTTTIVGTPAKYTVTTIPNPVLPADATITMYVDAEDLA